MHGLSLDLMAVLLITLILSPISETNCVCNSIVNLTAHIGRPFFYALEPNVTVSSILPLWLKTNISLEDRSVSLIGLPFITDMVQENISVISVCDSKSQCQCIHLSVAKLPERPPTFFCLQNHPILAVIQVGFLDNAGVLQTPTERIKIWRHLRSRMNEFNSSSNYSDSELGHAILMDSKPNFLKTLFVLAQAKANNRNVHMTTDENMTSLFYIWEIGCGYLDDSALQILSNVESRFNEEPTITDWMGLTGLQAEANILDWMVGEYNQIPKKRNRRQTSQGYQPIYPSRAAGAVSEASGLTPPDVRDPIYASSNQDAPILIRPIIPIEITVKQISNFRIPPNTFHSPDGSKLQLRLFEHVYPMQFGLDFKDPSAATGREIGIDSSSWVSFDSVNEILRLRPYAQQEGTHRFVLCAYNLLSSRTCTNINVRVKPPTPIKKSFIIHVLPGIYWCYTLPVFWFSELKVDSISDVEFSVTGDNFSWNSVKGEICILTKLQSEQIMAFFFHGVNRGIAEKIELELRIAVKVPSVKKIISSPRIRLRLRWMHAHNNYEMSEISRLNSSLAQVLHVHVNPNVNSQNIFIYDILQIRKFQEKDSLPFSKVLEIEFIYLPVGLPDPSSTNYLEVLEDVSSSSWSKSGSSFGLTPDSKLYYRLKSLCEGARLVGGVSSIQAAAESFRPFHLESVAELELDGNACSKILQKPSSSMEMNKIYPSPLTTTNNPYTDQVIENFTVEAGLAFRKRINPSKVVPMSRIRTIEIIDENYNRLNDTAWITVAEDKTNLFGLPLQNHARKAAYRFWLSILTVDQRTPINIHFTVDVVKWPLKMTASHNRYSWISRPVKLHNHRVRMRMKLGGTVGRGISPTYNWPPASPETSLSYRWNLVTNLDKYLRPECGPHCGVGIVLMDIQRQDQSVIQVEWALLPLLQEGIRDGTGNASYGTLQSPICPQRSIQELQRKLLKTPLNHRYPTPSSSMSTPHQEYFSENELRQASWSAPAPQLVEHLDWARLGTASVVAVDLIGGCFSPYWKDDAGGRTSSFLSLLNISTFIGETFRYPITADRTCFQSPSPSARLYDNDLIEVNETSWLSLDAGKCAIFGIVMKSTVSAGLHEFRIMLSPVSPLLSRVIIRVGDRNPRLPEVPNHRVLMQFEPGYAVRADPRTHMLQTMSRKWQFLITLDEYLRPECQKSNRYVCSSDMDILLINIAPDGDVLNVIWAKKSLVYTPSNRSIPSGVYSSKSRLQNRQTVAYGEIPAPKLSETEHEWSCPWGELEKLTLCLLTRAPESKVQPDLLRRFEQAGFGRLIDVKVERLGHCARQPRPFIPGDLISGGKDQDNGFSGFITKDWDWKWDYGELYEANGVSDDGQNSTSGLSTESPFYFMEFYNQEWTTEAVKHPQSNFQPDYTSQLPSPFDYLDRGMKTQVTTPRPNPNFVSEPPKTFQSSTDQQAVQQPASTQTQHRTFLLTTLLPICIIIVILLAVVLAIVWYLKCRGGVSGRDQQKLQGIENEGGGGGGSIVQDEGVDVERVPLKEDKKSLGKKNGLAVAKNGNQITNKAPGKSVGMLKDMNDVPSPPSKPLIFPNEKPPLKPPELMSPMIKPATETPFQPRLASTGSPSTRHFYAMGQRPDPYRNLPPPIDNRFGIPRQMAPQFGPYRRDPAV